ncbi:MAG: cardiolipin synthase, partial [Betaproteobacteria bacterium]|nr:cardiolipin synthase [Betaproteobacteria bacterium]
MLTLAEALALLLPLLAVVGLLHAFDAVMRARTPQGALAWVISLVAVPYAAIPLYWIFGRSRFYEYVEMLREVKHRHHRALERVRQQYSAFTVMVPQQAPLSQPLLEKLADFPFSRGNALQLLVDGAEAFEGIFSVLRAARRYILIQSYILRDDELGQALQAALVERAQAGVRVYLLLDSVGALDLASGYVETLRTAGVRIEFFRAGRRWLLSRFELNFRNHRKTVVVDGRVGFLGGLNFGDEYRGCSKRYGHWRDTHLRLEGPALIPQQMAFLSDWFWASGENLGQLITIHPPEPQDCSVLILPSGPSDLQETASLLFNHLISSAK